MLLEPDERAETAEDVRRELVRTAGQENSTILVADDDLLLGYIEAQGGRYHRNRHCAYVVIGVRQAASGRGVGTALLQELNAWAPRAGIRRLELTVMAHNARAISLYRKCGYEIEGTRRDAIRLRDAYVDEFFMARVRP